MYARGVHFLNNQITHNIIPQVPRQDGPIRIAYSIHPKESSSIHEPVSNQSDSTFGCA